jgi:MFS family permease
LINPNKNYKWFIMTLVVMTNMFVAAIPTTGISVLFKEISLDLHLSLVQVGIIWSIGGLPGILTSLVGGAIGDRFGPKRVILVGALVAGVLGIVRGLVPDFLSMVVVILMLGFVVPFVTMNDIKIIGQWFPAEQLGLGYGLTSMGMALGFLLGSIFSATLLSPLLGGWRNVMMAFGLAGVLISIPWLFIHSLPMVHPLSGESLSLRRTIRQVSRLRNVWLLGLTLLGVGGCVQGVLGYLPIYLRNLGWDTNHASLALSAFQFCSMLCVLPIALWSDRLGSRKNLLFLAAALIASGTALLSFSSGGLVWLAVVMTGFVRDGFMAIFLTMVIETEGVGPAYAGTAVGLTMMLGSLGSVLTPPLGNSLAVYRPGAPFVFWAASAVFAVICLAFVKSKNRKVQPILPESNPSQG